MLDHLLEEFEGNLTQIYRRKEIKYGAAAEDPEVMSKFRQDVRSMIAIYFSDDISNNQIS